MATLYACYHGPEGLRAIALRVHGLTTRLYKSLARLGIQCRSDQFFDTLAIDAGKHAALIMSKAVKAGYNLRRLSDTSIGISLDETTTPDDVVKIVELFGATK